MPFILGNGELEMKEEIMEILTGVRSDVDFENSTKLIDDGILESLDIVAIVGEFNETFDVEISVEAVSYTHLDVYKRQPLYTVTFFPITMLRFR